MRIKILLFFCSTLSLLADPSWLSITHPDQPAVNQLATDGNACGPACLLDAFRSGGEKWQKSIAKVQGDNDHEILKKIIRLYGKKGSRLDPKKARWNGRYGVNAVDLADMANELRSEAWMSKVTQEIFFKSPRENSPDLLKRVHKKLARSLKKGLPPIIRVRRVAFRSSPGSIQKNWLNLKSHFLVITGLPTKIPKNAKSFTVTYHDPWGGKKLQGRVQIPSENEASLPTLIANFPQSGIGKNLLEAGEHSLLSLSSALGAF